MKEKKRMGRPVKPPEPGKRISLGLKVTPEIKDKIDRAARENGRTQSQEAELRLEQSFHAQRLLNQVLELAYGKALAGLIRAIAEQMRRTGSRAGLEYYSRSDWTEI